MTCNKIPLTAGAVRSGRFVVERPKDVPFAKFPLKGIGDAELQALDAFDGATKPTALSHTAHA